MIWERLISNLFQPGLSNFISIRLDIILRTEYHQASYIERQRADTARALI